MELFLACHTPTDSDAHSVANDTADTRDTTDSSATVDTNDTSGDCPSPSLSEFYDLYDHDGDGYLSIDTPDCLLQKILNLEFTVDDDVYDHVVDELWDCDDRDASVNPGATEVCGNGTNDDCSTTPAVACRVGNLNLEDAPAKVSGTTNNRQIGEAIASAGDLNDDGFNDLVLGVPQTGVTDYGYVLFYDGQNDVAAMTDNRVTLQGPAIADGTGFAVAIAGDVNGDGVADLAVSRIYDGTYGANAGAVELLYGPVTDGVVVALPGTTIFGDGAEDRFGASLISLGDLDGDGFAELAVGTLGAADVGTVSVFDGASVSADDSSLADAAMVQFVGDVDDGFGANGVVTDFDGDGVLDLVVGAPYADGAVSQSGVVYVFYDIGRTGVITTEDADVGILGNSESARFGASVASGDGQDYDGDGSPDLLVGEPQNSSDGTWSGAAYLFTSVADGQTSADAEVQIFGQGDGAQLGYSVAGANLDGSSADIFVGVPAKTSTTTTGEVWQLYTPLSGSVMAPNATWVGFNVTDNTGYSLQNSGDLNGDGGDEVAVGSPFANRDATHGGVVSVIASAGE